MKIFSAPVVVFLAIFSLQTQEVHTETIVEIVMDMLTTTIPCVPPCVLQNFQAISKGFYETCFPQILAGINETMGTMTTPAPAAPGIFGPPGIGGGLGDTGGFLTAFQSICSYFKLSKTITDCFAKTIRPYCGNDLTNGLISQFNKQEEYLGCESKTPKAKILQCVVRNEVLFLGFGCYIGIHTDHGDVISQFNQSYENIYKDLLAQASGSTEPPNICIIANKFTQCLMTGVRQLNLDNCDNTTWNLLEAEINSALDLINCRTHNEKNDALNCLAKPDLIMKKIPACINNTLNLKRLNETVTFSAGGLPVLHLNKSCDIVTLADSCIDEKLVNDPACLDDGWSLTTYRALITPSRDFLINEHCQSLGKTPSNPAGAGTCKLAYSDYKYGKKGRTGGDGRPTGTSSPANGMSMQLGGSILGMWILWALHN